MDFETHKDHFDIDDLDWRELELFQSIEKDFNDTVDGDHSISYY